ncbi:MAG: hypothetical protein QME14_05370 [Methanobacteriaceae archaeon]|nr:hypothetical protein [Methanobacteriaceae archaeon]
MKSDKLHLSSEDKAIFPTSSIDFMVCYQHKPVMFIDFCLWDQHLSKGFIQYKKALKDEKKAEIKLKLKIFDNHYYTVAFEHPMEYKDFKYPLNENKFILNILDSLIGEVIIKKDLKVFLGNLLQDLGANFNSMNKDEKKEYIQDIIADSPLDLKWDPLTKNAKTIHDILLYEGIIKTESKIPLSFPEMPPIKDINDEMNMEKRRKIFQKSNWHGSRISCKTKKDKIEKEAWIRNSKYLKGSSLIITQNIARILVYSQIANIYGLKIG